MEMFVERVRECVELSQARLYDPPPSDDPYYLRFDCYDDKIHASAKEMITSVMKVVLFYVYNCSENSLNLVFLQSPDFFFVYKIISVD